MSLLANNIQYQNVTLLFHFCGHCTILSSGLPRCGGCMDGQHIKLWFCSLSECIFAVPSCVIDMC